MPGTLVADPERPSLGPVPDSSVAAAQAAGPHADDDAVGRGFGVGQVLDGDRSLEGFSNRGRAPGICY